MAVSMWFIADVFFLLLASIQRFEIECPDVMSSCKPCRMVRHRLALMCPMASTTHQEEVVRQEHSAKNRKFFKAALYHMHCT